MACCGLLCYRNTSPCLVIELEGFSKPLGIRVLPEYYEESRWGFVHINDYSLLTKLIVVIRITNCINSCGCLPLVLWCLGVRKVIWPVKTHSHSS